MFVDQQPTLYHCATQPNFDPLRTGHVVLRMHIARLFFIKMAYTGHFKHH